MKRRMTATEPIMIAGRKLEEDVSVKRRWRRRVGIELFGKLTLRGC